MSAKHERKVIIFCSYYEAFQIQGLHENAYLCLLDGYVDNQIIRKMYIDTKLESNNYLYILYHYLHFLEFELPCIIGTNSNEI